jgi:hypothetical protein
VVSTAARLTVECAGSGLGEWIYKPCPSPHVGRSAQLAGLGEPFWGTGGPCGLDGCRCCYAFGLQLLGLLA